MRAFSIRWFLLLLVLIAVAPGVIGTSFEIARSFRLQRQAALDSAQQAADTGARRVANFLAVSESIARGTASLPAIGSLDPARCKSELAELMTVLPRYGNIVVVDEDGWLICSAVPPPDEKIRRIKTSYYFDRMQQTHRLTIGYPSPSSFVTDLRIVGIAEPLIGEDGGLRGAVVLAVDLLRFAQEMPQAPNLHSYLLAGNGAVVSTNDGPQDLIASRPTLSPFFDVAASAETQLIDAIGLDGKPYLVAKAQVPGQDWTMIAAIPTHTALAEAYRQLWRSAAINGGILLLGVIFSYWLGARIARPLKAMADNIAFIRRTGQRRRFAVQGPAEIQTLARQANTAFEEADRRDKLLQIADQRLAFAIAANQDGVWDWNIAGNCIEYSDRWLSMLGYAPGDLATDIDTLIALIHPDDEAAVHAAIRAHLDGSAPDFVTEHRMRHKDGHYTWVLNRGAIVDRDGDGRPTRMVGTHTDINGRKAAELNLQRAGIVFDKSPQAIIVTDEKNAIQLVNPAFERATGYAAVEVIGRNPSFLSSGRQNPDFYKAMWTQLAETGEWRGEIWNRRKDGADYCEWLTVTQVRQGDRTTGHIGMFIDITQRKEAEAQIEWRANFDTLTALPNRHLLLDRIDQAVRRTKRGGQGGAVMLLDLDHFKEINDTLGHGAGDTVLIEVGRRLQLAMREKDTVGRLGGDEFVVLLNDVSASQAAVVAARIRDALAAPVTVEGRELQTGASIGVALFPADGNEPSELLRLADMAMYSAKAAGRGTWQMFLPQMDTQSRQRLDLITDLRRALHQDQIELFYQPIVDLKTGAIVKAEGLARWHHPQHGYIPPDQFIALAEETGIIHQLGRLVIEAGLAARRQILQAGLSCQIGVNLSARQIEFGNFATDVAQILAAEDMRVDPIVFEVTESLLLPDFDKACSILRGFTDAGAGIALDDFGTGYSSLNYLCRLPASILKIDRSFITDIEQRPDMRRLVQAIIDLGHDLGLTIVAEGIETKAQRDTLRTMGCDFAQGYYFAKPIPLNDLLMLLDDGAARLMA